MPIAPTVDADSFPELAQRSTMSTVVVFDKAPEDPISKPDEAESLSDTDSDAEDTSCVDSSVASYSVRKKKMKETREFRDQQKQSKKRSRTASSHSPVEEAEEIETGVARLVELGSPTREVSVSIPDQMDNDVDEEMDATELCSVSNPEEDISFSDGSIQPGQRSLDSQRASHVSETEESLGVPLSTQSTSIADKTLKAMEVVRRKKGNDNKTQSPKPNFKF
ncbi:hypothetical protein OUZ56_023499 [Daphnia magna]|uniref:Uncharacterized protein n=1 Tax=Daphnia magna TaxID=35525 RepID=A0ABR0AZ70_9CRUS|nr:hypothetical protein OUZ56_023499 [Daphnia magna]